MFWFWFIFINNKQVIYIFFFFFFFWITILVTYTIGSYILPIYQLIAVIEHSRQCKRDTIHKNWTKNIILVAIKIQILNPLNSSQKKESAREVSAFEDRTLHDRNVASSRIFALSHSKAWIGFVGSSPEAPMKDSRRKGPQCNSWRHVGHRKHLDSLWAVAGRFAV